MVSTVFPIFFSFYMGAWCDLFGRKLLFYIYFTAKILEQLTVIACAVFLDSPKEYLLLASLPTSLAGKILIVGKAKKIDTLARNWTWHLGGYGVMILAVNAFIADITEPDKLAFRYGMLHLASSLGRPLAAPTGAYLLNQGNLSRLIFWPIRCYLSF